jgi:CDP-diacylglycerol---glycerol-3-phosphate 3-phosphatidyltransferase
MATITPPRREPPVFNLPNQLTAARLVLGIVLFVLIHFHLWIISIVIFALAAITDWLDGYLARKQGLTSTLGRNLDPLVDKVVVCGAYVFLVPVENSGLYAWMATLVMSRELIITSLRSYMETLGANFGADWLGKVKMVLQCGALFAVFVALQVALADDAERTRIFQLIRDVFIYAMLAATALSGAQYLWRAFALLKTNDQRTNE